MKYYKSITSMAFVLVFIVAVATAANAPELTFKFTKNKLPGAYDTEPSGINNAGVTVGSYYEDTGGYWHGYILNGKKLTTLDAPKSTGTYALGLPYNGVIAVVGYYIPGGKVWSEGFLYKKGKFTEVPGPIEAISSVGTGINDKEEIVGYYADSSTVRHGFLLQGKNYTTLDVPGATNTYAEGINDKGYIVLGWLDSSGFEHSSLYKGKGTKYMPIDVPGAVDSQPNGINNEGDIAYWWQDSSGLSHGALLYGGKYYTFDYPKAYGTYGGGINDEHTIAGGYDTRNNGPVSGFKATFK